MIRKTTWRPDTCDCVIEYEWDDIVPADARTHSVSRVISRCNKHTALAVAVDIFNAVSAENTRKNKVLDYFAVNFPRLSPTWRFDDLRVLEVTVPTSTLTERTTAQAWCETNAGIGKVRLS